MQNVKAVEASRNPGVRTMKMQQNGSSHLHSVAIHEVQIFKAVEALRSPGVRTMNLHQNGSSPAVHPQIGGRRIRSCGRLDSRRRLSQA
jgi:hypothetical protein